MTLSTGVSIQLLALFLYAGNLEVKDDPKSYRYNDTYMTIDSIIDYSFEFLGTPYLYGGKTPQAFDCSGYIAYVFSHFNFETPAYSGAYLDWGEKIQLEDCQIGDIILFHGRRKNGVGHVGIVSMVSLEDVEFIHSANGGVQVSTMNGSKYYRERFICIRRPNWKERK